MPTQNGVRCTLSDESGTAYEEYGIHQRHTDASSSEVSDTRCYIERRTDENIEIDIDVSELVRDYDDPVDGAWHLVLDFRLDYIAGSALEYTDGLILLDRKHPHYQGPITKWRTRQGRHPQRWARCHWHLFFPPRSSSHGERVLINNPSADEETPETDPRGCLHVRLFRVFIINESCDETPAQRGPARIVQPIRLWWLWDDRRISWKLGDLVETEKRIRYECEFMDDEEVALAHFRFFECTRNELIKSGLLRMDPSMSQTISDAEANDAAIAGLALTDMHPHAEVSRKRKLSNDPATASLSLTDTGGHKKIKLVTGLRKQVTSDQSYIDEAEDEAQSAPDADVPRHIPHFVVMVPRSPRNFRSEAPDSEAPDSEAPDSETSDNEASDNEASDNEASDNEASDSGSEDADIVTPVDEIPSSERDIPGPSDITMTLRPKE